ncbi:DUF1266 domain-containing protein [Photobacterium sp. CCB-ST2H9]|uniref:DUF1266 domain-containing protein n=1 Tax=Photobacterium sp. CCB-ST2H9 TaxID=2912855 RepID=UPI0020061B84|nr:DUF1266 domain-containing protein [Photobacterium sp. CCB-ST2H9]UTM58486.1 DUF1266 domain-containing protein [Photobacterium sp. CCB-ST2H9]
MPSPQYTFDANLPHCQWWLAITSPQISYNREMYDYDIPGMKKTQDGLEEWAQSFSNSWNIESRREWHQMIHQLAMADVHGSIWSHEFSRRACMTNAQWLRRIDGVESEVAKAEMRYVDVVYRHVGEAGFRAWDYCRGSFLTRAGYAVGQVTQEEFAFLLNYLCRQIQHHFSSWEQYLQSFIFGRNYWEYMNDNDDDLDNIPYLLNNGFNIGVSNFFETIESDPDIPIPALAWQTALPEIRVPESLATLLNEEKED